MSLHKFAEQVASQGRGDDSLLVHMTPDEVRNLQQFAQANGRSLTINPDTGLPEAGMLSDLFKAIAPIALGAFLGPAGAALGGGFMSAGMAGLTVGGITTLATGSLSRGLMAGLGAYGGAGLGASMMGAGETAIGAAAEGIQGPIGSPESGFGATQAIAATPRADVLSAGFNAATASPTAAMNFAKGNLGNLAYAAAPIMAMQPTTKMPEPKDTGYIRQFDYNINPDTGKPDPLYGMRAMTPVKASEFGNKTFQGQRDLFRQQNPNPYELGVGSLNQPPQQYQQQPTPMNTGGIVALAGGGDVVRMAKGTPPAMLTDEQLYQQTGDWNKAAALRDQQNIALSHYNATDNAAVGANINKWITDNPFASTTDINKAITDAGLTQDLVNPYLTANTNISNATRYALSHATEMPGAGGLAGLNANILKEFAKNPGMNQTSIDTLQDIHKVSDADIQRPLSHGSQVAATDTAKAANYLATNPDVMAWINSAEGKAYVKAHPEFDANDIAFTHYERYGKGEGRKWEAPAAVTTVTGASVVPGGTQLPSATVYDNGAYGNYGSGPATGVDYRGNTVSIATPGDIITNPDQTRTVVPNVPGRPYGGFTGIDQLTSAYTAGGGSLGYTSPVQKDPATYYNKMTDDSLEAYNFLMGKGKNLSQRKATADRPVMRRYDEAVLGRKIPKLTKPGTTTTKSVVGVPGQPRTYFNEAEYLAANPDVAAEVKAGRFASAYDHWLMYGKAEGRPFPGDYEGYLTAAALANLAGAGGGGDGNTSANPSNSSTTGGVAPGVTDGNVANSITGLAQGVNPSISVVDMSPVNAAAIANEASLDAAAAAAVGPVGNAPGAPGGGGGGGGDGDGGGGGCVDPAVLITLADGSCVPAGSIKVGDVIFAMHEKTLEFGAYPVEYVEELDQPKALVLFDDGSSMLVSHSHKFFMVGGEWKQVYQLEAGDTVKAAPSTTDKTVIGLDPKGDGPVMKFTVTDAHTYISDGLISHNSKAKGGVVRQMAMGGYAIGGGLGSLGTYSDGGRLLKGPGDGVSDSIPATIGRKQQPARLADGEFVIPARIVSELGNGSTDAGAKKLYAMMDRVQRARGKTTGKNKVAANSRSDKYLPA